MHLMIDGFGGNAARLGSTDLVLAFLDTFRQRST